jgi:hypothetical protein
MPRHVQPRRILRRASVSRKGGQWQNDYDVFDGNRDVVANLSPPSGWIEDFHLQAVVHARHTKKEPRAWRGSKSRNVSERERETVVK